MERFEALIPYGRQDISESDIKAVVDVLRSDFLTQGPVLPAFEKAVSAYCGSQYAVAVNSATSALHMACLALGVGKGDCVWTTPITFVASANCAIYCGATVDFVDIDLLTYNLNVDRLAEKLALAEKSGNLPKVVIPVHLCGQSCDMASIYTLSQQYGFKIIEDASHAIGGKYKNETIGNCRFSDITVFSFHPVKIITSGEGGMVVTNDPLLAKTLRSLRSHGISINHVNMTTQVPDEIWNYRQVDLGFNYRMTDIQAALCLSQMDRLNQFVDKRHILAETYNKAFADLSILTPFQNNDTYSAYHLYPIRVEKNKGGMSRNQIFEKLLGSGINVNLHYIPVYRHPYYVAMGFKSGYCPEAEKYFQTAISLPIYSKLSEFQQDKVIYTVRRLCELQ